MPDSKDELEIVSTDYHAEDTDADAAAEQLSLLRDADQKVESIAKRILQLKSDLHDLQNNCENSISNDSNISNLKEQLAELLEEYKIAFKRVLDLAKEINFDVEDLECPKIDIDRLDEKPCENLAVCKSDDYVIFDDCEEDNQFAPVIIVGDENMNKPNMFICNDINIENKVCKDEYGSICSCTDESTEFVVCGETCCVENRSKASNHQICNSSKTVETDYEKEAIRDNLMILKGRMKLLHQQNIDLLSSLNNSNQRTRALSNVLHKKPAFMKCKMDNSNAARHSENNNTKSNTYLLKCENERLRDELKEMKRDQCQIELARKILNVADSQCVNCVGTSQGDDNKTKLNSLREEYNALMVDRDAKKNEIANLMNALDDAKHKYKTFEDCLIISKAQVAQLEKQLFDLDSAKTHDPALDCSNNKYLLENLKSRLKEAIDGKTNMQLVLDFHLTELEDKKNKYLAVLQTNEELKYRNETLLKEKNTISQEYDAEFKRMNDLLKSHLEEIASLPCTLASTQQELENEKSARNALEIERDELINEINALKICLENAQRTSVKGNMKDLEEENTQLKARINTLEDSNAENKRLYMERTHYSLQLKDQLDVVREEAAMQVTQVKDFSECQRQNYSGYIQKLEQELAECRAIACSEFKKRDKIDERLRERIDKLTNNLNEAHKKIGELKNTKEILEIKSGNELCMVPVILQSTCENLNKPKNADWSV